MGEYSVSPYKFSDNNFVTNNLLVIDAHGTRINDTAARDLSPSARTSRGNWSEHVLFTWEWSCRQDSEDHFERRAIDPCRDRHTLGIRYVLNILSGVGNGPIQYTSIGHRVLNRSLNSSILATFSPRGDLLIAPIKPMFSTVSDPERALAQSFALAIVNNSAYDDLLRAFESEMRKMDVTSLDSFLSRVWSTLQSFGFENTPQIEGNGWLVSYLEFATAAFR